MVATILSALLAGSPISELDTNALHAALEQAKANGYNIVNQIDLSDDQWLEALLDLGIDLDSLANCSIFQIPWCNLPGVDTPDASLPETPTPPETETPETSAPSETETPETSAPSETETPETSAPSETETPETPAPPETETPETPAPPETETPETQQPSSSMAVQVANLVNQERAKVGLAPVELRTDLTSAAQIRAQETVTSFSHTRPNGTSFYTVLSEQQISYRGAGENIAWGQRTAEAVMTAWMNSEGHRANILNPSFQYIGVGYYTNAQGTPYWAQLFTY